MPGEREGAGPDVGLQAGARPPPQRQGEHEAGGEAQEERDPGAQVRHGVLRQLHQNGAVKVSILLLIFFI